MKTNALVLLQGSYVVADIVNEVWAFCFPSFDLFLERKFDGWGLVICLFAILRSDVVLISRFVSNSALFIHISIELEVPIVFELRRVLDGIPGKLHRLLRVFEDRLIMDILYLSFLALRGGLALLTGLIDLGLGRNLHRLIFSLMHLLQF